MKREINIDVLCNRNETHMVPGSITWGLSMLTVPQRDHILPIRCVYAASYSLYQDLAAVDLCCGNVIGSVLVCINSFRI